MKLFKRNNDISILGDISMHIPLGETDTEVNMSHLMQVDGQVYKCHSVDKKNKEMLVDLIHLEKNILPDETIIDTAWTCPVCHYIDEESFELDSRASDSECPQCGAITEYEIEYVASYTVTLKKKPGIQNIQLRKEEK